MCVRINGIQFLRNSRPSEVLISMVTRFEAIHSRLNGGSKKFVTKISPEQDAYDTCCIIYRVTVCPKLLICFNSEVSARKLGVTLRKPSRN